MSKDQVKELIEENFKLPRTLDLYKEFLGKTQIEIFKEEDEVIRRLVKGETKSSIVEYLKGKHPDGTFSFEDLDKFIERNDEINEVLKKDKTSLAKRWLKAKTSCMEEMAQLMFYTKQLIPKLDAQGDARTAISAVRTMQDLLLNYMELEGYGKQNQAGTQVNVVVDRLGELRKKLHENAHQADFVIEKSHDEVSTDQNPPKDKEGHS